MSMLRGGLRSESGAMPHTAIPCPHECTAAFDGSMHMPPTRTYQGIILHTYTRQTVIILRTWRRPADAECGHISVVEPQVPLAPSSKSYP